MEKLAVLKAWAEVSDMDGFGGKWWDVIVPKVYMKFQVTPHAECMKGDLKCHELLTSVYTTQLGCADGLVQERRNSSNALELMSFLH